MPPKLAAGVMNATWYEWAIFAGVGAAIFAFLPDKAKWPMFWMVIAAGVIWLSASGAGGLPALIKTVETGGAE